MCFIATGSNDAQETPTKLLLEQIIRRVREDPPTVAGKCRHMPMLGLDVIHDAHGTHVLQTRI